MPRNIPKSGKQHRQKTAERGKRYLCAKCRKRSPKPVKSRAPWYCAKCRETLEDRTFLRNKQAAPERRPTRLVD